MFCFDLSTVTTVTKLIVKRVLKCLFTGINVIFIQIFTCYSFLDYGGLQVVAMTPAKSGSDPSHHEAMV
jgi:hypothetical protein